MSEPCTQAKIIEQLDAKVGRVIELLEEVAVQRTEIKHLMRGQQEHREWLVEHGQRIRGLEAAPGRVAGKALVVICTMSGTVVGSIVSSIVVWSITNGH